MTRRPEPLTRAAQAAPAPPIPLRPRTAPPEREDPDDEVAAPRERPIPAAIQDLFAPQPTPTAALPPPEPMLETLTRFVVEIIAGARDLDQVARWVTDEVYRTLLKRVVLGARARQARGERSIRPVLRLGRTLITEPADGVVEAVTIVHGRGRSRAVAIRLEGIDRRWRATAIAVL